MSAYLTALALKGETIDEITASAAGMRAHCIKLLHDMDVLVLVETAPIPLTFPPLPPLVIAAGGVPVAKHGNRAAFKIRAADGGSGALRSQSEKARAGKIGICFLFAIITITLQ